MVRSARAARVVLVSTILLTSFIGLRVWINGNSFNAEALEPDNIVGHIETLSSPEYAGRVAGSRANERALEYIRNHFIQIGVEPAGVNNTWNQPFTALIPEIDAAPVFSVADEGGTTIREFVMYEDYRVLASGYGSGLDFSGDLILIGHNLSSIDPALLYNRIVVLESHLMVDKKIEYVLENGGRGVLFPFERNWSFGYRYVDQLQKSLSTADKSGARLMVGNIGHGAYRFLTDLAGDQNLFERERPFAVIPNVEFKAEIRFPVVNTMNLLGRIDGRGGGDRVLLLTAAVDGVGADTTGRIFPGAVSNVSGIATLLEIARVVAAQKSSPYKTIVFAVWNGEENQNSGSRHYADHPLFPLEKTTVVHLDSLGGTGDSFTRIESDSRYGRVLQSKLKLYAGDAGLPAAAMGVTQPGSLGAFIDRDVPGVLLKTGDETTNAYDDTVASVNMTAVEGAAGVVLSFLKRDVYRDLAADYLRTADRVLLWVLVAALSVTTAITAVFNTRPGLKIRNVSVEQVYFHPATELLRKSFYYLLPIGSALFLLVLLVNLPPNGTIESVNGESVTNYSVYLSVKNAVLFLRALLHGGIGTSSVRGSILQVTLSSSFRSLKLIAVSLLLSLIVGIGRSVIGNYRKRGPGPLRSVDTLVLASVPDVAVVLAGLLLYVYTAQQFPDLRQVVNLKEFVLPLVTLSILPSAYISRMSFITIREELRKEYVRHALAKGYSKTQVFAREVMPAVFAGVLDAVPTLMTVILTNLIIVEYLFNYQGIIYYLLYFYKQHDGGSFIALAVAVGGVYVLFTSIARLAGYLINPMKRKNLR
jgi:ABC-type dipeptide/oligopeptide/nickel transport system permease component